MTDEFKAIVIAGRSNNRRACDLNVPHGNRTIAYAFEAFSTALAFMQATKSQTVVVEFSVETDTIDFYDAVKALGVPVVFSANRLEPSGLLQLGIRAFGIAYPGREDKNDGVKSYPSERGTPDSSNINLIASSALLDA